MIVIINTGIGNFKSIQNMLNRIGEKSLISDCKKDIAEATKIILPGVGSFDRGMQALQEKDLIEAIKYKALIEKTPILGICLGMQILGQSSEEGSLPGLSLIKGHVKKFNFTAFTDKKRVPHMGWNYVVPTQDSILFQHVKGLLRFYFTHSYYFVCDNAHSSIAITPYGLDFTSVIQHDNIYGVQFHPEKSHRFGWQLLKNFATC